MFDSASKFAISGGTFAAFTGHNVHYHGIREILDLLYREVATAALHNSKERFDPPKCHPKIRMAVLSKIMEWIKWEGDLHSFIMWLYGSAGVGKSAIVQTIAEMCEEEMILLASFFFSRTDPSRNSVQPLIATIAYQITLNIPDVQNSILRVIERDPLIFSKSLVVQFKSLIVEPLQHLVEAGFFNEPNSRRLVIIDGLDECFDPNVQRNILEVLTNAHRQHRLPLLFLFASRPEEHISHALNTGLKKITMQKGEDIRYTHLKPPEVALVEVRENFVSPGDHDYVDMIQTPGDQGYTDMIKLLNSENFKTATAIIDAFKRSAKADSGEIDERPQFFRDCRDSSMSLTRLPYKGLSRKLVVAIDVGTTFSGVSYCDLYPGEIPEIRSVNRYPAQELVGGSLKIPTIMYYDRSGAIKAAGAEAAREGIAIQAEEEQWIKAEWFKVWLHPKSTHPPGELHTIPPLPLNKSIVEVFGDFLRYIFECTKTYIQETHTSGPTLWESFGDEIYFVLTHPNGYEGPQQTIMRSAAVRGGLVPDDAAAEKRVSLVTEGEASLHYCFYSGLIADAMKDGKGVMVVDCGDRTIDFSSYAQNGDAFEEIAPAECLYTGSVFITSRARVFFAELLKNTRFEEDVGLISDRFEKRTIWKFRDQEDDHWIQFGSMRDNDQELGIRAGQLKVKGTDVASFFEPSITDIVYTIADQNLSAEKPIKSVFIVGGFAANDWFFSKVKEKLEELGIDVSRPDSHVNKAVVAHGAVSYYIDHRVTTRISKYTFGIRCGTPYDRNDPEHVELESTKYRSASGEWYIPNAFQIILPRKTQVAESKEFRQSLVRSSTRRESLGTVSSRILCYRGELEAPKWIDTEPDKYTVMCTITAQLDELVKGLRPQVTTNDEGKTETYYLVEYDTALLFGLTEFKASVIWEENGEQKRSDAVKIEYTPNHAE